MEGKDILILFICATAILISFPPTGHIKFTPTWQIKVDTSNYRNGNSPLDHEKLPPPIVTDLDQDGFKDIIYLTTNYEIKVVDAAEIYDLKLSKASHKNLPELDVTFSSSLLPKLGIRYGRKPIALSTGFIDDVFTAGRKQVIIVLTESWLVMCFDAELNLLWESNPVSEMDQNLYHSEAAIEIISTPVRNGDRGLVIIGGRTIKKDIKLDRENGEKREFEEDEEQLLSEVKEDEEEGGETEGEVDSEEDHFSYYAFNGETGDLRWSHEPGDFEDVPSPEEFERFNFGEFVDESFKKFFTRNVRHLGEVKWYQFASDILENLPYRWRIREDTSLTADRFDKRRQIGGSNQSQNNIYDSSLFNENNEPINKPPNVIVSRNSAGIEVIHLYSGRPLTTLKFTPGSLFDDINGDNVIDKVDAISDRSSLVKKGEVTPTMDKCFAIVTSGNPSTNILFEGSICDVLSALQKIKFGFEIFDAPKNEKVEVVPPLSIKLEGKTNLIFLVSSGKITSYSSDGTPNWQISTDVKWNNKLGSKKKKSAIRRFPKLDSFRELGGFPTLESFPVESQIQSQSSSELILAVGSSTLALINPEDGVIFTESHTPGIINAPPIVADWDTDGYNDLIFSTANGFYGWRLESTTSSFLYPIISIGFIVALIIISFTRGKTTKKPVPSDNSQFRL